jgi:hypothetical protein
MLKFKYSYRMHLLSTGRETPVRYSIFFTISAPATEPNPTLDRRNRVLRTATPCSAGSVEIRARDNGLLRAAADARVAPVGLEPAGSVKISYMPTHARTRAPRRAAAGQPPEAIVPRLHACMHGRQSMQHARERGIMARRRPSTRALALPRTTSNIGALTSNTQHDSMAGRPGRP